MSDLPVNVEVDPASGVWSSDGQPMILIPRRFFVFIQKESESRFGIEATQALYETSTRRGARVWCQEDARLSGMTGPAVFERYMDRVSRRGMGRFRIDRLSVDACEADVSLTDSIFVAEYGRGAGRPVCYSFAASLAGAMEFLREEAGLPVSGIEAREVACEANGAPSCRFEVRAVTDRGSGRRNGSPAA